MEDLQALIQSLLKSILEWSPRFISAIIIFMIGWYLIGKVEKMTKSRIGKSNLNETLKPFTFSVISIGLKLILLAILASVIGIKTTSFVAVLGALVFAVGMALQGTLGHIASGLLLLIFRPYSVGDFITIGDYQGFVQEIQIINTIILSLDNEEVIIPNGMAIGDVIINSTGDDGNMRFTVEFFMPYEEKFSTIQKVTQEAVSNCQLLENNEPLIGISAFESHSIKVDVKAFCKIENYEKAFFELSENVKASMGKNGIKVAYSEAVELGPIGEA